VPNLPTKGLRQERDPYRLCFSDAGSAFSYPNRRNSKVVYQCKAVRRARRSRLTPNPNSARDSIAVCGAPGASASRSPFDNKWYAHIDGKTYGPYSGHEVRRLIGHRKILDTDFLCREGAEEWIQAKNDRILGAFFQPPSSDSRFDLTGMGQDLDETESEGAAADAASILSSLWSLQLFWAGSCGLIIPCTTYR
jgi:hypothetical protein